MKPHKILQLLLFLSLAHPNLFGTKRVKGFVVVDSYMQQKNNFSIVNQQMYRLSEENRLKIQDWINSFS
jgi:hypothetical protein